VAKVPWRVGAAEREHDGSQQCTTAPHAVPIGPDDGWVVYRGFTHDEHQSCLLFMPISA